MTKKVAVINDLSGLGKCSLTAAIPVLSCLGVQACPLPTAVLSNQTGYDSFFMDDYTDRMPFILDEWERRAVHFDGIYTGFLAGEAQVALVEDCIRRFRRENTLLVVDPVMGDNGSLYSTYALSLCVRMRQLAAQADVITPNLTEAFLLLDEAPDLNCSLEQVETLARRLMALGPRQVVITGAVQGEWICNVLGDRGQVRVIPVHAEGGSYSGTGDLLASVVTAGLVQGGQSLEQIVRAASRFIAASLAEARRDGTDRNDGVAFEHHLPRLWAELQEEHHG